MAGKNSIQVLRGTAAKRIASSENLLAGQPFFETDTGKFYVGNGGAIKSATPIVATPAAHTHTVANITDLTATATELNYCDGVTSSIQTQLNNKAPKNHASTNSDYGLGSTSNYGHVKISNGDVASVASATGLAAGMDHSHSNYALSGHTHDTHLYIHCINATASTAYDNYMVEFMIPSTDPTPITTWEALYPELVKFKGPDSRVCCFTNGQHRVEPSSTEKGYYFGPILYLQSPTKTDVMVRKSTYNQATGRLVSNTYSDYDEVKGTAWSIRDTVVTLF